jgi:hypothetical protein
MLCDDIGSLGRIDIAHVANRRIWDFVHEGANLNLRAGTGYYSTPFRGSLFGEVKAADVAKQLCSRGVDALWLGTNPCVPDSLNNVINPPADSGDFPSFKSQIESGFFGSSRWGPNGKPEADFNPIEKPTGNWQVYRDVLAEIAQLDCVAMANFIPWGSENGDALVNKLGTANRPLLERALEFADDLNAQIVQALAPKLVVVPFSLGRNRKFDAVRLSDLTLARAIDSRPHRVPLPEGAFSFHTGRCQRGSLTVRTVFLPHPASLRLHSEAKKRLEGVVKALQEL